MGSPLLKRAFGIVAANTRRTFLKLVGDFACRFFSSVADHYGVGCTDLHPRLFFRLLVFLFFFLVLFIGATHCRG